ncbi:MAG TPA: hypothetical protein EYG98_04240 [Sulfurovum sp.]|nr:hypothetical protein [Sulfurovum sp.]
MLVAKIRKNFLLDKELIEKAQKILLTKHNNLTEAITTYFRAVVKDPEILQYIEKSSNKRTGSFIGILDGKIGANDYKELKKSQLGNSEKF